MPESSFRRLPAALLLLTACTLTACTGTEERPPALRLALLTGGGAALGSVDTAAPNVPGADTTFVPALTPAGAVTAGQALHTADGGRALLLLRRDAAEKRDATLAAASTFPSPPFTACWTQSALNSARTRLLLLSECPNDAQQLALYATDGTLIWSASAGSLLPAVGTDAPPVNIAVVGDVAVLTRPALGGGSEVIRAAPRLAGDTVAVTTPPERTVAIRDLALQGNVVYAATDSGVYPLLDSGLPDLTKRVTVFGSDRVDRLWGASLGRDLLFAWKDNLLGADAYLRVWNGVASAAQSVTYAPDLRDLTVAPDGNLYVLTRSALTRFDAVLGLQNGNWQARTLVTGLNDARALAWLVP